jgi:hypothetical protein
MAARQWTPEQRAAQSAAIQEWQPWQHSTGACTLAGKAIISRNAYRGGTRPLIRFSRWLHQAIEYPDSLTPEIVEAAKNKSIALLSGNAGYWETSLTKLITNYGHKFSETEVTDLQELVKVQNDFKTSLMK